MVSKNKTVVYSKDILLFQKVSLIAVLEGELVSENKRCIISVPQLPDESFVTNRRIYLFCVGICEKCKPRNEGCRFSDSFFYLQKGVDIVCLKVTPCWLFFM